DHFVIGRIRPDTLKKIYTAVVYALGLAKSGDFTKYVISYNELRISLVDFLSVLEKNALKNIHTDKVRVSDSSTQAAADWGEFQGECMSLSQNLVCSFWRQEVKDLLGKRDPKAPS